MKLFFQTLFMLVFLSCSQHPVLLFKTSLFQNHLYRQTKRSQWHELFSDSMITIKGVYVKNDRLQKQYLQIYSDSIGFAKIELSATLNFENSSLVEISGKIIKEKIDVPYINKPFFVYKILPDKKRFLSSLASISLKIRDKYLELLPQIQAQITPRESKLRLKTKPVWEFYFDANKNEIIAITLQHDLMYQAAIEFFIDAKSGKIKTIRANEWFKGEVQ